MRLLVTGGRNYLDRDFVYRVLDAVHAWRPVSIVIHGNAAGADALSAQWAEARNIPNAAVRAYWKRDGGIDYAAGHRRNRWMMRLLPEYAVVFPGGRGTAGMVEVLTENRIEFFRPVPGSDIEALLG